MRNTNGDIVAQIGQPMAPCITWEELMTMQNAGEARLIAEAEEADAKFIANAKSDMGQLLEAVEQAREIIESLGVIWPEISELTKISAWLKRFA